MTRPFVEKARVLSLAVAGWNATQISRATGIPRPTVREWMVREGSQPFSRPRGCPICEGRPDELDTPEYAYLFGQYLGDGTISLHPRGVRRLRIFTASVYPAITGECAQAMQVVCPGSKVGLFRQRRAAVVEVYSYSKHWPCLFPQSGAGRKHERQLLLERWQETLFCQYPEQFLRGLIHSDGCRCINRVTTRGKTYEYPRYLFSNRSIDIQRLFGDACDLLGIEWRNNKRFEISIAKRESVAKMDEFVGPKS
jgi:hypothetical protein